MDFKGNGFFSTSCFTINNNTITGRRYKATCFKIFRKASESPYIYLPEKVIPEFSGAGFSATSGLEFDNLAITIFTKFNSLLNSMNNFIRQQRFCNIIISTHFHNLDCGAHITITRNNYYR